MDENHHVALALGLTPPWCLEKVSFDPELKRLDLYMDWASRKTLSWRLSKTLDPSFCVEALE